MNADGENSSDARDDEYIKNINEMIESQCELVFSRALDDNCPDQKMCILVIRNMMDLDKMRIELQEQFMGPID